jgi:hypothetical protein
METLPESVMLRCIANRLETSQFYAGKGNRALADWWHDRADMYSACDLSRAQRADNTTGHYTELKTKSATETAPTTASHSSHDIRF